MVEELGLLCIDTSKTWYTDDPFILANQANQVYYLNDIKRGGHWKVVQKVQHREIYEVTEIDEVSEEIESGNNFNIETNQEISSNEATSIVGDDLEIAQLYRLDVEDQHINMSDVQVEPPRDAQSFLNDEDEDTEIDSEADDQISLSDDDIMPPKRIEHLPVMQTPTDGSSSSNGLPLHRETRGTHSDRLRCQISTQGRLPITFRHSDGHPIGPNAASFMTELGLSATFDINFQEGASSVIKETDRLMSSRYRDNRTKMHNQYKKLSHLPPAERRQHIPIEFCETQDDWDYMCTLFESEAFQVLGTRSEYIRGLGSGSKLVRSTSSDATSSIRSTNTTLREKLESTQEELANTKVQLASTQDELASMKSRQDKFEQILNRLAPEALDSLIHDSSSVPPPPTHS
ncbi:hypothetical protein ZIOFF_058868 [Zingiber officinale]|uniref:DUF4216 domain-containing protein n=1 Tax=Zingiber officinale TaxID=94328 RepID=A0A8J5KJQ1_ZINOF|nr:hypothetical protein ZIOFF_058868 [Zingiber officinale]